MRYGGFESSGVIFVFIVYVFLCFIILSEFSDNFVEFRESCLSKQKDLTFNSLTRPLETEEK
jgi:hypothetical protein